jgi:hypothetical protein
MATVGNSVSPGLGDGRQCHDGLKRADCWRGVNLVR